MEFLKLNDDCIYCIFRNLDVAMRFMLSLVCSRTHWLSRHHTKLFNYSYRGIVGTALKLGSIPILRHLKDFGVKYLPIHLPRFRYNSVLEFRLFVQEISSSNNIKKERLPLNECITNQSTKEIDLYIISIICHHLEHSTKIRLFEKWDVPFFGMHAHVNLAFSRPDLVGRLQAKKTLKILGSYAPIFLNGEEDAYYSIVIKFAFMGKLDSEFYDEVISRIRDLSPLRNILSEGAIHECDPLKLDYLSKRKLVASVEFQSQAIKTCSLRYVCLRHGKPAVYAFFRRLFKAGVRLPIDIFTDERSIWKWCPSYSFIKFFVEHGALPDKTGRILKQFPSDGDKYADLLTMGFE